MVRSTRWPSSQWAPSAMSARMVDRASARSGRSRPGRVASSAAETAKLAASSANGAAAAAANRSPTRGGPTRVVPAIWTVWKRALARGRPSRSTTIGRAAWEALWNTVSAVVVAKKTTSRTGIDAWPVSTARASSPRQAVRARSAATISQRRSARSATAPLGSANSSHGRVRTTPTAPILRGSSVSDAASSGAAATVTPSPRLDAAAATSRVRSARDRSMGQFTTRPKKGPGRRPTPPGAAAPLPPRGLVEGYRGDVLVRVGTGSGWGRCGCGGQARPPCPCRRCS